MHHIDAWEAARQDSAAVDLEELQRQRDLVQKHLAWLDRQIAKQGSDAQTVTTDDPDEALIGTNLEPLGRQTAAGVSVAQKAGCLALMALFLLIFLGLLFVLPNFLYK